MVLVGFRTFGSVHAGLQGERERGISVPEKQRCRAMKWTVLITHQDFTPPQCEYDAMRRLLHGTGPGVADA